jgi:hypothetical protein
VDVVVNDLLNQKILSQEYEAAAAEDAETAE